MPLISGRTQLAANEQTNNVLEGSSFEFIEGDSVVRLNLVNLTQDNENVQCLFQVGGITLIQPPFGLVHPLRTNAEDPAIPNDVYHAYIMRGAPAGSRLFMSFQNTAAGTPAIAWMLRIDAA